MIVQLLGVSSMLGRFMLAKVANDNSKMVRRVAGLRASGFIAEPAGLGAR